MHLPPLAKRKSRTRQITARRYPFLATSLADGLAARNLLGQWLLVMAVNAKANWSDALERAKAHAPFLARALERQSELEALLARGQFERALNWARKQGEYEDVGVGLRRHRLALATTIAIADLAEAIPLSLVLRELTDFADHALDRAIRTAIAERTGAVEPDGMIALAMGKQGAGELNYSSDIDPILLYDPATLPRRENDDPGEVAQRYARRIVKLMSDNTADGYVLRVDLRLRPASEISPLAVPRASALSHYQGQALAWERAAFVRARAAAGDVASGEAFLGEIAPFVWRQALDYGAIDEIRALTARIRDSHEGPQKPEPGFDVKRGRGGIREIEFFAQTNQLIHGGRDSSLRVRGTRAALDALADAGCVSLGHAKALGEGYDRLRVIEHRLQMVHDRQTHSLPHGDALEAVARLDGLNGADDLIRELTELTERTGAIYDELIGAPEPTPKAPFEANERAEHLRQLGFVGPEALAKRIEEWRDGRYAAVRSAPALEAFDLLLPRLLEAFANSDDPERAITRWQNILERTQSAITVFHLLFARPELLERLTAALTLSPILADELGRRPELLDALLDRDQCEPSETYDAVLERMCTGSIRNDYEAQLDRIRHVTGEQRFTLGIALIEAEQSPASIGAALSQTAEAAIARAAQTTAEEFACTHGSIVSGELVVLGLGRLGGGALTHASDLDMIYLFSGDFAAESDGERPLGATLYFNRLASRVSTALSVPTAQGALYEVDTRLRPQGNQGPLAVSLDAFEKYQKETAWTWEHMALARARVLVGGPAARSQVERIVRDVLCQKRDEAALREAVLTMRSEISEHKQPRGILDVKLQRGGLVDVEFLIHFLQLRHAHELASSAPDILDPSLMTAIKAFARIDKVPGALVDAYDLLTAQLVAGRLLAPDGAEPPPAAARALARACGQPSYPELVRALTVARTTVAQIWGDIFEQTLEI